MTGGTVHRLWAALPGSSGLFEFPGFPGAAGLPGLAAPAVAVCLLGTVSAMGRTRRHRRRLTSLLAGRPGGRTPPCVARVRRRLPPLRAAAAPLGALALGAVLVGGPAGWALGAAAAWSLGRLSRGRGSRTERAGRSRAAGRSARGETDLGARVDERLPVTAELLAACLAAGSGPCEAAGAVGASVGGPLGERLVRASAELRLGGDPVAVWERLGELPEAAGLARCLERAGTTGVPAVEPVGRLAAECRAARTRAATGRARRAAVLVTGPLGLCFLPAFLLAGVVPVVIGLARSLL
ncbi:type II secretion system F family protein [Streptomyces sp. TRM 70361]|uniref:type II secretion system F family protein n=1 Tax=Streptomyces sp. TRM 70361 TaxID=3116553 RepID=UPI002E7AB04E|nr:type II secretion system F family protein [Streptomyces sp. TRM 70361]MEE1941413.1 type II secretion system F family protein [Streptomyces sp. TRM 70361]